MDIVSDGKSDMILVPTQSANTVRFLHFALIDNLFLFTLCFEVKSEREMKSPQKTIYTYSTVSAEKKEYGTGALVTAFPYNLNIVWHVKTQSRAAATLPAFFPPSLCFTRKVQFP